MGTSERVILMARKDTCDACSMDIPYGKRQPYPLEKEYNRGKLEDLCPFCAASLKAFYATIKRTSDAMLRRLVHKFEDEQLLARRKIHAP